MEQGIFDRDLEDHLAAGLKPAAMPDRVECSEQGLEREFPDLEAWAKFGKVWREGKWEKA